MASLLSWLFMCMHGGVFVFALCLRWCGVCLWVCSNLGQVRGVASWAGNEAHLDLINSPLLLAGTSLRCQIIPSYSVPWLMCHTLKLYPFWLMCFLLWQCRILICSYFFTTIASPPTVILHQGYLRNILFVREFLFCNSMEKRWRLWVAFSGGGPSKRPPESHTIYCGKTNTTSARPGIHETFISGARTNNTLGWCYSWPSTMNLFISSGCQLGKRAVSPAVWLVDSHHASAEQTLTTAFPAERPP